MKMKYYVLGFVFNKAKNAVLLIEKKRPEWQAGYWNGIGGKIEENETPVEAIEREAWEEMGLHHIFDHALTFVCPGGTVFVYYTVLDWPNISFKQKEDEPLKVWPVNFLPEKVMASLRWLIPVCLSSIQFPILVQQNTLGVE